MMRILFLIKSFDFGGAENHVRDLANAMDESGNQVFVASSFGTQIQRLNKNVRFIPIRMADILLPFHIIRICILISKNRIEVIHAHKRIAILLASISGRIMKIPVVATVHGRPRYDLRSWISKVFPVRIIFVSKRTRDANMEIRDFAKKSVFIPNGAEIFENKAERDYYSISYISRIDKRHSSVISLLIRVVLPEILRDFPQVSLNIIGDGKYLRDLKREALDLNTFNNRKVCKIHGYLPEVKSVILKSGVVLGVGRAAIEALACAIPVIPLNQKFMGRFITEQNFLLYQHTNFVAITHDPPDPVLLTKILMDYFKDPEHYHEEAKNLLPQMHETFCMKKIAGDIFNVYRDVCHS